jgi:hypothetical protein
MLRNILILVVVFFCLNTITLSQNFALKGGYLRSEMELEHIEDFDTYDGFQVGLKAEIPIYRFLFVQTGVYFSKKGFVTKNISGDQSLNNRMLYIDMPLKINGKVYLSELIKLYAGGGMYAGYGADGYVYEYNPDKNEYQEEVIRWGDNLSGDYPDHFTRFDYGLTYGGGIEIWNFQLGIDFYHGMANISPAPDNFTIKQKNAFSVYLAFFFQNEVPVSKKKILQEPID